MKHALVCLSALFLAACATDGRQIRPGVSDEAAVRQEMGAPREVHALPQGGQIWFYPTGLGRRTYRVELSPEGKVRNFDQVLDENHFDRIAKGITAEQLRLELGPPFYVWHTNTEEVWEYKYDWGLNRPWTLYVGIAEGRVTGQHRHQELNGPSGTKG